MLASRFPAPTASISVEVPAAEPMAANDGAVARLSSSPPSPRRTLRFNAREQQEELQRKELRARLSLVFAPILGLLLFGLLWHWIATLGGQLPTPAQTWDAAVKVFSDPFYSKGPNDQGIGWNILSSLKRVGLGFTLAAIVAIPLGFVIGRFMFVGRMAAPLVSLLKPV